MALFLKKLRFYISYKDDKHNNRDFFKEVREIKKEVKRFYRFYKRLNYMYFKTKYFIMVYINSKM